MISLARMEALPRPTPAQREGFIEQVCAAHSWYKHLSYAEGTPFVVFLAPDAGAGFEERRRIHHTWETTAQYRARFGHLDYMWQETPGGEWCRDAGSAQGPAFDARGLFIEAGGGSLAFGAVELPETVASACSFTLHPWCSNRRGDTISFIHGAWSKKDYIHETRGKRRPSRIPREVRRRLTEMRDALDARDALWDELTEGERNLAWSVEEGTFQGCASPAVERYVGLGRQADEIYEALHQAEVAKIRAAVEALERLVWPG